LSSRSIRAAKRTNAIIFSPGTIRRRRLYKLKKKRRKFRYARFLHRKLYALRRALLLRTSLRKLVRRAKRPDSHAAPRSSGVKKPGKPQGATVSTVKTYRRQEKFLTSRQSSSKKKPKAAQRPASRIFLKKRFFLRDSGQKIEFKRGSRASAILQFFLARKVAASICVARNSSRIRAYREQLARFFTARVRPKKTDFVVKLLGGASADFLFPKKTRTPTNARVVRSRRRRLVAGRVISSFLSSYCIKKKSAIVFRNVVGRRQIINRAAGIFFISRRKKIFARRYSKNKVKANSFLSPAGGALLKKNNNLRAVVSRSAVQRRQHPRVARNQDVFVANSPVMRRHTKTKDEILAVEERQYRIPQTKNGGHPAVYRGGRGFYQQDNDFAPQREGAEKFLARLGANMSFNDDSARSNYQLSKKGRTAFEKISTQPGRNFSGSRRRDRRIKRRRAKKKFRGRHNWRKRRARRYKHILLTRPRKDVFIHMLLKPFGYFRPAFLKKTPGLQ
jgi:hypothetical protein